MHDGLVLMGGLLISVLVAICFYSWVGWRRALQAQTATFTETVRRLENEISERRTAERLLHENQQSLHLALAGAGAGVWDWSPLTDQVSWSDENYALFGIDPDAGPPRGLQGWLELLHPDDRRDVQAALGELAGATEWKIEYRIQHPERGLRWLESLGRVEYTGNGAFARMTGISLDITERKFAEKRIHHLAHYDVLTGLLNRFSLRLRLDQAIAEARRDEGHLAILFIDMDRFKSINDSLGHEVGDQVLIEVAQRLRTSVRENDLVGRLGGDEFIVVLTGMVAERAKRIIAMVPNIVRRLAKAYSVDGHCLNTTPSVGISLYPRDGDDAESLMKNADTAMYHAKAQGRNNFQFFSAEMNLALLERRQLEQARAREAGLELK